MFKRLIIGLLAVGLVVIVIAEAANALVFRGRNTVVNYHTCDLYFPLPNGEPSAVLDPCYGADLVSDTLYGWDVSDQKATCLMTGTVVCEKVSGGVCTDPTDEAPLTIDSFTNGATFVSETRSAEDHTVLPAEEGQPICDDKFPPVGDTIFSRFWPDKTVAVSVYQDSDGFPNIPGEETTYTLIEYCTIEPGDDFYDCERLWDSVYGSNDEIGIEGEPMPHLPCCGIQNTLTVIKDNIDEGDGTITSIKDGQPDGLIDCGEDCNEFFDGDSLPFDGCPEVTLTAVADEGSDFTGWSVPGCTGTGPCIVNAKDNPTVTASFTKQSFSLTVNKTGEGDGTVTSVPSGIDCGVNCSADFFWNTNVDLTAVPFPDSEFAGWEGSCPSTSGANGEICTVNIREAKAVTANFDRAYYILTVKIEGGGGKGRAYIWSPRSDFDDPDTFYCYENCIKKFGETYEFPIGQPVVIKRKGTTFIEWGGDCEGTPNSSDTCSFDMDDNIDVVVKFAP